MLSGFSHIFLDNSVLGNRYMSGDIPFFSSKVEYTYVLFDFQSVTTGLGHNIPYNLRLLRTKMFTDFVVFEAPTKSILRN